MNPAVEQQPSRTVTWHGEGRSLFYVVDTSAPEAEQPAILETFCRREEAECFRQQFRPSAGADHRNES